jgi:hypothetical protein
LKNPKQKIHRCEGGDMLVPIIGGFRSSSSLNEVNVHAGILKRLFASKSVPGPTKEALSAIGFQVAPMHRA